MAGASRTPNGRLDQGVGLHIRRQISHERSRTDPRKPLPRAHAAPSPIKIRISGPRLWGDWNRLFAILSDDNALDL